MIRRCRLNGHCQLQIFQPGITSILCWMQTLKGYNMQCRFCKTELTNVFIDLVNSPASNSFLVKEQLQEPETFFPLKVFTCHKCFLVQVDEFKKSDSIFDSS